MFKSGIEDLLSEIAKTAGDDYRKCLKEIRAGNGEKKCGWHRSYTYLEELEEIKDYFFIVFRANADRVIEALEEEVVA